MWKIKDCPRCKGDLLIDRRTDPWYEQCLQCGYRCESRNTPRFEAKPQHKIETHVSWKKRIN